MSWLYFDQIKYKECPICKTAGYLRRGGFFARSEHGDAAIKCDLCKATFDGNLYFNNLELFEQPEMRGFNDAYKKFDAIHNMSV